MPAPINLFKKALANGDTLFGCWLSMGESCTAEIMGRAGFDWLLIDSEHAPNDVRSIRDQLMALESSDCQPIVRVPIGETWIIKQMLDLGAQTLLVPIVETGEQARDLVKACHYPPKGIRGVGYSASRAGGFGQYDNYGPTADDQICLLVQVETKLGLENLGEILAVDGIDGVFIGPADLSASFGYLGQASHPEMTKTILNALKRISDSGKAAGILTTDDTMIKASLDAGARFVAVGVDIVFLISGAKAQAEKWQNSVDS